MEKMKIEDFDQEFLDVIERLAGALKVEPAVMLENIFIRRIAEERASDDVFGPAKHLMPEFMTYGGKAKRGHELYKMLYNLKRRELEHERIEQLRPIWEQKSHDVFFKLSKMDQDLLTRYQLDPVSQLEYDIAEQDIKEAKANGEISEVKVTWTKKE